MTEQETALTTEQEKAVYKRGTARRLENWIRLKQIKMNVIESQAVGFSELFETWVSRYGKTGAMDLLIRCMAAGEASIQDEIRARQEKKRKKKRA